MSQHPSHSSQPSHQSQQQAISDKEQSKVGRPRKRKDIRKLVVEMALANLGWGYENP